MTLALPVLADSFRRLENYQAPRSSGYALLPFRFIELDADRYVATNLVGEYAVLPKNLLRDFAKHRLPPHSQWYDELKSKHFLMDKESDVALDLLATKYRTKQSLLPRLTSLFMFITTLRCDHSCPYCQVSRQSENKRAFDMTPEMADRAIEFMFQTPAQQFKIEFQGGESLLNFELIKYVVGAVNARNADEHRDITFVIATNLSSLTDEHLDFCRAHRVYLSTSLDGPRELHNRNRPRPGRDSYERTADGIARVRAALGDEFIAALMTTTVESLSQPRQIIDEYVRQGFTSIFLRSISPYGFAVKTGVVDRYRVKDWLSFYEEGLSYILELNRRGIPLREEYASILLTKILTPWPTGYVDLQSPAGTGISGIVFNYDGDIYASDEGRMLAEMSDKTFRLGNIFTDSYDDVMGSDQLVELLRDTMLEGMPLCSDCGFQPYCGSDPVFHHATQGDVVGFKPTSDFCGKNMFIIRHLIKLLEDDAEAATILRSWV